MYWAICRRRLESSISVFDRPPSLDYLRRHVGTLVPYVVAATLYVAIGVLEPRFLLSWAEGIVFLMLVVSAVPAVFRRLRR